MDIKDRADALTRRTEDRLRALQWKTIIDPHLKYKVLSDGALVVVGAFFTLAFPHLKDLLQSVSLFPLKTALSLLLLSSAIAIYSRKIYSKIRFNIDDKSELSEALIAVFLNHSKEFTSLKEEAQKANVALLDNLDAGAFIEPLRKHQPKTLKLVADELAAREIDPEKKWKDVNKLAERYSDLIFIQLWLIVAAVGVMLIALKEPK